MNMMLMRNIRSTLKRSRRVVTRNVVSLAQAQHDEVQEKNLSQHLEELNQDVTPHMENPLSVLQWSMNMFDGKLAMSTSFGIQSAVLLHLATQVKPDIPVIWVDTGYLPAETYEYAETLKEALDLNLVIKTNTEWTPARMEAVHGKLWEKDHVHYGRMRKVEPLTQGIRDLKPSPKAMLSGLRASQTQARANMPAVGFQHNRFKVLPILKMTDDQVEEYFDRYDLPRHPLESKGYVTVGDWHSSRPVQEGEDARATRFGGKFQECGLHAEESVSNEPKSEFVAAANDSTPVTQSYKDTGLDVLKDTKVNPETDTAVILVKKIMGDGSFCRKCIDVQGKLEADDVEKWIGSTVYADTRDATSDGLTLAKHFDISTAPFFLTRTREEAENNEEWKVVKAYLPLRKTLQKRAAAKQ